MIIGMRKRSSTIIAVIAGLVAVGMIVPMIFTRANPGGVEATIVVAKVGRERITALDLKREVYRLYQERGYSEILPDEYEALRSDALDNLIEDAYILDAAKKANYVAPQSDIDAQYEAQRQYFTDESEWVAVLASSGYSVKTFKQAIADSLLISMYPSVAYPYEITDEEIQAEFEKVAGFNTSWSLEESRSIIENVLARRKMQEARDAVLEEAKKSVTPEILDPGVLAYRAYNEGNYQEAVKQYKRYAKDAPEDPYVLMPLGVSYVAVGDRKNATSTFRKADKLAGDDAYYYVLKGRMLGQQKDAEGADEALQKAAQLAGDDIYILGLVYDGYNGMGNTDRAAEIRAKVDAIREANRQRAAEAEAAKAEAEAESEPEE
ncbi:MAG: SurA N-terminal domain-containing protein [Bacillota bacterium]|nr:tetratricopeptide repeat protein [Bacillota bacterium]